VSIVTKYLEITWKWFTVSFASLMTTIVLELVFSRIFNIKIDITYGNLFTIPSCFIWILIYSKLIELSNRN